MAPPRVVELYCGIGGVAAALADRAEVVTALDVSRPALEVYRHNFEHRTLPALLDSVPSRDLERLEADLWWASPPCQPFTRRGHRRDLDDPRAATFRALLGHVEAVRPPYFALENVVGFETSGARELLLEALERAGYARVLEGCLCPTDLGMPSARPRYYLLAAQGELACEGSGLPDDPRPDEAAARPLDAFLDPDDPDDLRLDPALAERYRHAIHVVHRGDPGAVTRCFTSAYGRSPVRSGSYLATASGPRHFSPAEVLRLLGFGLSFRLPPGLGNRLAWRLVGNSLAIGAVRRVLSAVPALSGLDPRADA